MLADWEESQATNTDTDSNGTTDVADVLGATTRWSLDVWTDYESYKLLDVSLDSKRIEDEDDYTIWLLFYNNSHRAIDDKGIVLKTEDSVSDKIDKYLYYDTLNKVLWETQSLKWKSISFSSIYAPVEINEIIIQFSAKSSDRVAVDESQTELYSTGYPSFDWDMDFSNRTDGTCKRMETTTETKFTVPVPTSFINSDPEKPNPEQFKLEFELAYKQQVALMGVLPKEEGDFRYGKHF